MVKIKIENLLFWILIALLIALLLWRAFGSSPTVEAIGIALTAIGALFGWRGIRDSNKILSRVEVLGSIEQEEKKQTQILSEIKTVLEKR